MCLILEFTFEYNKIKKNQQFQLSDNGTISSIGSVAVEEEGKAGETYPELQRAQRSLPQYQG